MRNDTVSQGNCKGVYQFGNKKFDEAIHNLKHQAVCDGSIDFLICIKNLENEIKNHQQQIKVVHLFLLFFLYFLLSLSLFSVSVFLFQLCCKQSTIDEYCSNALNDLEKYWTNVNGDKTIDSFESNWSKWKTKEAIKWFQYILSSTYTTSVKNMYNEYAIENLSDDESESESESNSDDQDDEKQQQQPSNVNDKKSTKKVDYNVVEQQLNRMKFRGKRHLPFIEKSVHFHAYGFENKTHCKILFKAAKQLIEKYPKTKDKTIKRQRKEKKQENEMYHDVEGFVSQTNAHV